MYSSLESFHSIFLIPPINLPIRQSGSLLEGCFQPRNQQEQSKPKPLGLKGFLIGRFLSRLDSYLLSMWSCCFFKRCFFGFQKKIHPRVLVRRCFNFYESSTITCFAADASSFLLLRLLKESWDGYGLRLICAY